MPFAGPSLSVVVPAYNRGDLIAETLDAILSQSLAAAEVIVVDDGSTDDTAAVASRFPVQVFRVVNGGPGVARNAGVLRATRPWIAFCDSDDLWRPGYLEAMRDLLQPGMRYGFGNWRTVRGGTWESEDKFASAPAGYFDAREEPMYRRLLHWTAIWPSATVIRRDFFDEIGGFDPRVSRYPTEDFEFALRCNEGPDTGVLMEPLVGIRRHEGNFSGGQVRAMLSDIRLLRFAREHHRSGRRYPAEIDREIERRTVDAADLAFKVGEKKVFRALARDFPRSRRTVNHYVKLLLAQRHPLPGSVLAQLAKRM